MIDFKHPSSSRPVIGNNHFREGNSYLGLPSIDINFCLTKCFWETHDLRIVNRASVYLRTTNKIWIYVNDLRPDRKRIDNTSTWMGPAHVVVSKLGATSILCRG